jgi:hypothetical protein
MRTELKRADKVSVADFRRHPVWTFVPETRTRDETWMKPVRKIPVSDLENKIIGTRVLLSNGHQVWAAIGNVDVGDARRTAHFMTLSVRTGRAWFHLARYHDIDYKSRGPGALAKALGLPISDVFPITYDLRTFAYGNPEALLGQIPRVPTERLSRSALMRLIIG